MNSSDSILYFPSIEIRDPNWLKASLLIWDKVYRIAPNDYTPRDDDNVKSAIDAGLVDSLELSKTELSEAYDMYNNFLEAQPFTPDGLDSYGSYDQLHKDKIDSRLYPILEKVATEVDGGFLKIPSELARGYMLFLANNAAKRRGINIATDNADAWVIASYFNEGGNFSEFVYGAEDPQNSMAYTNVGIKDLIPIDLASASISDIIKFSTKYKDEKDCFKSVTTEFLNELRGCAEKDHAIHIVEKYGQDLINAKKDFVKSSSFLNKSAIRSSLVVGVPVTFTVLSSLGDMLGTENNLHLSSSLLLGFVAAMAENKLSSNSNENSVGNYLVNMDKDLAKSRMQPNYSYLFDQFIND
ncbi:hypothetical protein [Shewanella spartinae]|uniref:hypothetical protein n=1 Tax=Shewanella spartinae TaxID=2864205 RepID=UPI001C65D291|nr:hypothetical protein [Shewanella spartinae]QYJ95039.1 hypothetical protein K0I31_06555 [Shewanella spartinae]